MLEYENEMFLAALQVFLTSFSRSWNWVPIVMFYVSQDVQALLW